MRFDDFDPRDFHIEHYGTKRHSGRYAWGSGGDDNRPTGGSLLDRIDELKRQGLNPTQIAKSMGMSTTDYRALKSIAKNEKKQADIAQAERLRNKGYGFTAIGKEMGIPESSVRSLLEPGQKDKLDILHTTSNMLKDNLDSKGGFVQIGSGVENHLGISETKLMTAVAVLKDKGYRVHSIQVEQLGTQAGQKSTVKVLCPPGTTYTDVKKNMDKIRLIDDYSENGGRDYTGGVSTPLSIDSKRIAVKYGDEGGAQADGVIYVRPGKADVSLGGNSYAQVRIAVDGTHYLKGMAMYKDDLPPGVDLVFNTKKSNTGNKKDAFKDFEEEVKVDNNPFGAHIKRQIKDDKGNVTSVMNLVNEEGTWDSWSKNLSSQVLSKQNPKLAKEQLEMKYEEKKASYDRIMELNNPAVRRLLLDKFAREADGSATHLEAAQIPRASWHAILPFSTLKDNEVYAPNFRDGEQVALIRYPHGGTFEIPELKVNNKNPEARKAIGRAQDAIGINAKVAQRMSGADFDGDAVMVIPNNRRQIKSTPALADLKNFDPIAAYPKYVGMPKMSNSQKQQQMGSITNLIADMTLKGADPSELARAIKHSMVVIDAQKHDLNYKLSSQQNGISALMVKYQEGKPRGGASTLITRAESKIRIPIDKPRLQSKGGAIDPKTGKLMFTPTGESWVDAKGKVHYRKMPVKRLSRVEDARTLSSGTTIEGIYADHSNRLKALANQARLDMIRTKSTPRSPSASTAYAKEVASLNSALNIALKNRPLERQAQLLANSNYAAKIAAHPELDSEQKETIKAKALINARRTVGAGKKQIKISTAEWDAIQAGAISNNKLSQILDNADLEIVRALATPKSKVLMTSAKTRRAQSMIKNGYTQQEIADHLGVSLTTLKNTLGAS